MITKAKIVGENIGYETYSRQDAKRGERDFSMSRGELVNFSNCPAKWIAGFKADDEATPSTDWGSMIDCLLTSPDKFDGLFAVAPETYPDSKTGEQKPWTGAANFCKAWKKEQGSKTIIKTETHRQAVMAVEAIQEKEIISELFSVSKKQVMVIGFWKDEATKFEIPIRVLIDLVPQASHETFGKWLADLKTARNGNPNFWARVIDDSGYDVQAALIMDLFTSATGEDRTDFVHIVQENVAPFHVVNPLPALSAEFLAWGRAKYKKATALYCKCLSTGNWPSYEPVGIQFGNTQIIDPKDLYSYKKCAGMAEFRMPDQTQPIAESDDFDDLAGA